MISGSIKVDEDNLKVYFFDNKSNKSILLHDGNKLMFEGMHDTEYTNIESIGHFRSSTETREVSEVENINNVYLQNSIEPYLKEFLENYIDADILSFLVDKLKNYEVTLYDCCFFKPYENHNEENYINGTNSILFESDTTYGYCYVIHKFRIDESVGLSIYNEFEFISPEGDKQKYIKEIEFPTEDVLTEEQEF